MMVNSPFSFHVDNLINAADYKIHKVNNKMLRCIIANI